jgi:hypothetical protein
MMNGKDCRFTRREIDESELNQRLSDAARTHVASCASCRGWRAERTSLRELVGSLEPVTAPGDFEMRLRARLANEKSASTRQPFFFRFVTSTPALAGAALVLAIALSLAWFAQRNISPSPEVVKAPIAGTSAPPQPVTSPVDGGNQLASGPVKEEKNPTRSGTSNRDKGIRTANVISNDYGTSPAASYRKLDQRAGEVSLTAPLKPMVVSMQDDRGETRRISLPPVSFGAQKLGDNRIAVSTTNSRSW